MFARQSLIGGQPSVKESLYHEKDTRNAKDNSQLGYILNRILPHTFVLSNIFTNSPDQICKIYSKKNIKYCLDNFILSLLDVFLRLLTLHTFFIEPCKDRLSEIYYNFR